MSYFEARKGNIDGAVIEAAATLVYEHPKLARDQRQFTADVVAMTSLVLGRSSSQVVEALHERLVETGRDRPRLLDDALVVARLMESGAD